MIRLGAFILALVVASALGVVAAQHQARKLFAELEREQARARALEVEWGQLQLEQSVLASEAVVDYAARTRLDMVVPAPTDVVYVRR